ncbi:MAG: hypothetical protein JW882_01210 [Deltaproteobacteria bacterium]|nr:hypothetical protein [Deltaproteobacteria bacterium]
MITSYQVKNVLRIYGNQLKKRSAPVKDSTEPTGYKPDFVDISMEARKKQMVGQISNNIISQIDPNKLQKATVYLASPENSMNI